MSDILSRSPPAKGERVQYGEDPLQFGELRFPKEAGSFPVAFVIHGGFWSAAYDLVHIGHLCSRLTSNGVVTCSLEYRRVGNAGGGWPGTLLDIAHATEFFRRRMKHDSRIDLSRTVAIGHSAGGHLAFWHVARHRIPEGSVLYDGQKPWFNAVISLAGVMDLHEAWDLQLGSGAVEGLIGGSPDKYPDRYRDASPFELLPTGLKQILIHGSEDKVVPVSQSENFVQKARAEGDSPSLLLLDGVGHFELIDPESRAWDVVERSTLEALRVK